MVKISDHFITLESAYDYIETGEGLKCMHDMLTKTAYNTISQKEDRIDKYSSNRTNPLGDMRDSDMAKRDEATESAKEFYRSGAGFY